jgi:hypothetical protein
MKILRMVTTMSKLRIEWLEEEYQEMLEDTCKCDVEEEGCNCDSMDDWIEAQLNFHAEGELDDFLEEQERLA